MPCPARRRMVKLLGTGAIFSVLTGITSFSLISANSAKKRNSSLPGGIACIRVVDSLSAYVAQTIEENDLRNEITLHLMKCEDCSECYEKLCKSAFKDGRCCRQSKSTIKSCPKSGR